MTSRPKYRSRLENWTRRTAPWNAEPAQVTRLPIDRVFTMKGFGTVVTGTLLSGELQAGQPGQRPIRQDQGNEVYKIRSIEVFNKKEEIAVAGQRTAVNLAGASREQLQRGMILSVPGKMEATAIIDAEVCISILNPLRPCCPACRSACITAAERILPGFIYWAGNLYFPEKKAWPSCEWTRQSWDFPGDSFILRRYSPATTIGGGLILHNSPPRHRRKELDLLLPDLEKLAEALSGHGGSEILETLLPSLLKEKKSAGTSISELSSRTGETPETIKAYLRSILIISPGFR